MAEAIFGSKVAARGSHNLTSAALAWRNLWRNRRRTWLTIGGIAFAVWLLVFARSMQDGTFNVMIDNGARLMTGHLQVQHPLYLDDPKVEYTITDLAAKREQMMQRKNVLAASARAQAFALVSQGELSFGAQIVGVQADLEQQWSSLPKMSVEGRYLANAGEAFLGATLAHNLSVKVGDEVVVLGTAKRGGVAALALQVVGTFASGQMALDRALLQINLADFQDAWGLTADEGHALLVISQDLNTTDVLAADSQGQDYVVLDWPALMPEAQQTVELKRISTELFFMLIAVIVTFSVVNTFMMTIFERRQEIGTLKALGMRAWGIMATLQIESLWLWFMGVGLGFLISYLLTALLAFTGIPVPAQAGEILAQYQIPDRIYPLFNWQAVWYSALVMLIATQLAAFIPGLRITRLDPVVALRAKE